MICSRATEGKTAYPGGAAAVRAAYPPTVAVACGARSGQVTARARACARGVIWARPRGWGTDPVVAPPRAAGANSGGRVTTRRRVSVRACGRAWLAWLVVRFRLLTFSSLRFSDCDGRLPRTGRPAPSSFFSALLFNGQTICVLLYNPV